MRPGEVCVAIFGEATTPLAERCLAEATTLPRFRVFLETYASKIRKKLRNQRDEEGVADLALELDVAARLARESSFAVAYETFLAGKQRGPDFTVTYRGHTRFTVEVKRLRQPLAAADTRLAETLADKIGQLPPQIANVIALSATPRPSAQQLAAALARLGEPAQRRDDAFYQRRGYAGARDFLRRQARLSALLALPVAASPAVLWRPARPAVPLAPDLARTLLRAFS